MKNIFKYVILEQLLTENRIQQAKDKYPCIPPQLVNYLAAGDPSGNNKYLDWMCKQVWDSEGNNTITGFDWDSDIPTLFRWLENRGSWSDGNDPTEAPYCQEIFIDYFGGKTFNDVPIDDQFKNLADSVIEEVKFFHRFVNGLPVKDINSYNYNTLKNALAGKKLQAQEKEYAKNVQKLYEDSEWLMVSPKTHQASCAYGANTKWCVTMKNDPSYYANYTDNGEYLIFIIDKTKNQKWAIHTKIPFTTEDKTDEIKLPWHREVRLFAPLGPNDKPRERFGRALTAKETSELYQNKEETTYWNAEDDSINYNQFIKESNLPEKLQQLLKFLNNKFKVSIARKKRTDIPYEINENPVRLKKGDKVKLLASGYGYFKGDEGYVIGTYAGANPRLGTNLTKHDAGVYVVYVPGRFFQKQSRHGESGTPTKQVNFKKTDKLLPKLNLKPGDFEEGSHYEGGSIMLDGLIINGVFLKKI